jgi:flagellar motor component MotA
MHNLKAALAGTAVGVVLAYAFSGVLQSQLFEVRTAEPIVYAASAVVMWTIANPGRGPHNRVAGTWVVPR